MPAGREGGCAGKGAMLCRSARNEATPDPGASRATLIGSEPRQLNGRKKWCANWPAVSAVPTSRERAHADRHGAG